MFKKNVAIIYACSCDDYAFQVATSIMSFEKNNNKFVDNYIIFCDKNDLSMDMKRCLCMISDKIIFRYFEKQDIYNVIDKIDDKIESRYSYLIYTSVYSIDYLKNYKNVLWLGADTIAVDDVSSILEYKPLAWRKAVDGLNKRLLSETEKVEENHTAPNGDLIFMNEELGRYNSKHLIDILNKNNYQHPPNEFLFSMFAFKYNINVNVLPKTYLCLLNNSVIDEAKIIHGHHHKFWKYNIASFLVPEWIAYYNKWISLGGKEYRGECLGPANFPKEKHKVLPWIFTLETWDSFYKLIWRSIPDSIRPSLATYNKTLPFYIKQKSNKTYYYCSYKWQAIMTIGFAYRGKIDNTIRNIFKNIYDELDNSFKIDENEKGIFIYSILKFNIEKNAQCFIKFIKRTIYIILNSDEIK